VGLGSLVRLAGLPYLSPMQPKALPGFRDFYPEDFALRRHILDTWRRVALRYGFEEYDGPPLESLELYAAKSGDELVGQLYAFADRGGREVALRPEMTPTLARMVAARVRALKKPVRWFSMPQLFRYERQQRGRLREHFQLNCDLLGEPGPLADAEIIALAIDVMRAFGLTAADVRVRVSDRRVLAALLDEAGISEAQAPLALQLLDKAGRGEYGGVRKDLVAAGAGEAAVRRLEGVQELRTWAALEAAFPGAAAAAGPLQEVFRAVDLMGLAEFLDLDLTIVRGLAYYTGPVFELFDAGFSLRAICGGGRYDRLLEALGGESLPALGFGMGDVVLGELLRERGLVPPYTVGLDVFVAAVTAEDLPHALALAHTLRDAGLGVEYPLALTPLAKQLRLANARGARYAVVIGPDDRARNQVVLRDLASGAQQAIPAGTAAAQLRAALQDRPTPDPTTA
jgi:histidyl-tRNA synthetase